jgi:carbonic anhydrase
MARWFPVLQASLALFAAGCGDDEGDDTASPPDPREHEAEWSYSGATGPDNWGRLDPMYETCDTGREQSPIDLAAVEAAALQPLVFNYEPSSAEIENNGHTVVVEPEPGSHVRVGAQRYQLVQFHYHAPSEHAVAGKHRSLEIHFVHAGANKKLLVLGALVKPGDPNGAWDMIAGALPAEKDTRPSWASSTRATCCRRTPSAASASSTQAR